MVMYNQYIVIHKYIHVYINDNIQFVLETFNTKK